MTRYLWMWWQGYVTVRLRGPGLERLLNRAAEAGLHLFGVERLTTDVVIVRIAVSEFNELRPMLRGSQISVAILDRHGVPFLVRRFKMRLFLLLGLVLSFACVIYFSNYIWFIEVTGNEILSASTLKIAVEDQGLRTGIPKSRVNPRRIEGDLLQRFPELAWVQVRLEGVKVAIQIAERDGLDRAQVEAGHLYAKRDGVIAEILVLQGTPDVREGDTVRKDDLLVSGVYYDQQGRKQFGAAQGIIKARTWYQASGEAPLVRYKPQKTGVVHRQYKLTIGPLKIPVGRSYPPTTHLETTKEWSLSLGSAMVPISFATVDYEEIEFLPHFLTTAEAEQEAYQQAWESLQRQGVERENVLEEKTMVETMADADGLRVTVRVEVLEDIGQFLGQ